MEYHLEPNLDFVNSSFQGYSLSPLDNNIMNIDLSVSINIPKLSSNNFSKVYAKMNYHYNAFVVSPYEDDHVYFLDSKFEIRRLDVNDGHIYSVFKFTSSTPTDDSYPSIEFITPEICLAFNGKDTLNVIKTSTQKEVKWNLLACTKIEFDGPVLMLRSIARRNRQNQLRIQILFISIGPPRSPNHGYNSICLVELVDFIISNNNDDDACSLHLESRLCFVGPSLPTYVHFETGTRALHIAAEYPFEPISDRLDQTPIEPTWSPLASGHQLNIEWTQTNPVSSDSCYGIVKLKCPNLASDSFLKAELKLNNNNTPSLVLTISNSSSGGDSGENTELFNRPVYAPVADKIECPTPHEIWLYKAQAQTWPRFFASVTSPVQSPRVLTREDPLSRAEPHQPTTTLNADQLEEVDFASDEDGSELTLQRIDPDNLMQPITHQTPLIGYPWLFNVTIRQPPRGKSDGDLLTSTANLLVVRHDVDAAAFLPSPSTQSPSNVSIPLSHVTSWPALGYVLASKCQRRFIVCPVVESLLPPFVALADVRRLVYVFLPPPTVSSEKSSYHVVTLDDESDQTLVGLAALPSGIVVTGTENQLFVIKLPCNNS